MLRASNLTPLGRSVIIFLAVTAGAAVESGLSWVARLSRANARTAALIRGYEAGESRIMAIALDDPHMRDLD